MKLERSLPILGVSAVLLVLTLAVGLAQSVMPVGRGSYASAPPPQTDAKLRAFETKDLYLVKETGQPIPTNKWWTQLVVSKFARSLWAYPLRVDTSERGLDLFFPVRWQQDGRDPQCDFPLNVSAESFKPADARAKDWSDWVVSFRMAETPARFWDVTLGEGMPCLWLECHDLQPILTMPGGANPVFFDVSGKSMPAPSTEIAGDGIGFQYKDRQFAVFGPDGTRWRYGDGRLRVGFPSGGRAQYLVVCALPAVKDIAYFHRYAFAVPRDTQLSWAYDAPHARVTTTWKVTAEPLKGTQTQVIQGWIPHHYRNTVHDIAFSQHDYLSPRGKLKCSVGNRFVISYPYTGILPNLPGPKPLGGAHDFDGARMHQYMSEIAAQPQYGADTYWGGKDILRFGQCALMAQQIHDPTYKTFVDELRTAMTDWYTYRPGEKDHYFAYYPHWKALVGMNPSYGSEEFNDHHFHYGYFTFATALLQMQDPSFGAGYGEMARLVAKDYANWDRADKRFPFLRTFDIWAGHSWAGGTSSPGGNNQESSSEAMQSWAGLIYLGEALGDNSMRDAGIMGYATESQATMEYWFNAGGDVFPPEWKHPVTGMVWSGGKVFGTYFTGDPAWVYGIQWLPASPMLSYLVKDRTFARKLYEDMCRDYTLHEQEEAAKTPKPGQAAHVAQSPTIVSFGPALGSVMLGYVLMYDPNWAAEQLDTLWNRPGDKIAHDAKEMAVIYYQAQAMRSLGQIDWNCHGSSPTSMVYKNPSTGKRTYIVWNPASKPQTVTFYDGMGDGSKPVGHMLATPQALTSVNALVTN